VLLDSSIASVNPALHRPLGSRAKMCRRLLPWRVQALVCIFRLIRGYRPNLGIDGLGLGLDGWRLPDNRPYNKASTKT
jgi:hypothetical protein